MVSEQINELAKNLLSLGFDADKISSTLGTSIESTVIILGLIISIMFIWTFVWKAIALWKSANNKHKIWFIIILLPINTVGILEILYIYVFSKIKFDNKPVKSVKDIKTGLKKKVKKR